METFTLGLGTDLKPKKHKKKKANTQSLVIRDEEQEFRNQGRKDLDELKGASK